MIMKSNLLPFKDGQYAEAKSFVTGYRSAWFRCKIKDSSLRKGQNWYLLEFFDYPDEKERWTKSYQRPKHEGGKTELMVRPPFPDCCLESQLSDSYPVSGVVAAFNETRKVGDLVDWWSDGCYWSGRVIRLLGEDKVQIQLPEPPAGEGKSYPAFCKDLRPSLNWSLQNGWTVPLSRKNGNSWHCARLVWPHTQVSERDDKSMDIKSGISKEKKPTCSFEVSDTNGVKDASEKDGYSSNNSEIRVYSGQEENNTSTDTKSGSSIEEKPDSLFEESDSSGVKDARTLCTKKPSRKHLTYSTPIESSLLALEEIAIKIRWIKGVLQFGYEWSNARKPSWRFLDNCGASPNCK